MPACVCVVGCVACGSGVAHPPGYPLFILLAKVAMWLGQPWRDRYLEWEPAVFVNAFNAVLSALTSALLFDILRSNCGGTAADNVRIRQEEGVFAVGVGCGDAASVFVAFVSTALFAFQLRFFFCVVFVFFLSILELHVSTNS